MITGNYKKSTLIYHLPQIGYNKENIDVCKKMFLATLGNKSDRIITKHITAKRIKGLT